MKLDSTGYIIGFAATVCLVASVFVSGSAVALKDKQDENKLLDQQKKVLTVSGLINDDDNSGSNDDEVAELSPEVVRGFFADAKVSPELVSMPGYEGDCDSLDVNTYDVRKAAKDPAQSYVPTENEAKVSQMANCSLVYNVTTPDGKRVIVPIRGPGLWSTLRGYLAVDQADGNTVKGLIFYEHAETPGLGGEVDNSGWRGLWPGRKVYDGDTVSLGVRKGPAGTPEKDPYNVDGLSGATLTGNGVTKAISFWLGPQGFGPFMQSVR